MRKQCARGGCACCFRTEGAPTYRAQAVPQPPQLFSSGLRVHPPNPPSRGSFLLSASFRCSTHKQSQSTTKHRPVRSTKSVGPQQKTRTSNPCKGKAGQWQGAAGLGWISSHTFHEKFETNENATRSDIHTTSTYPTLEGLGLRVLGFQGLGF